MKRVENMNKGVKNKQVEEKLQFVCDYSRNCCGDAVDCVAYTLLPSVATSFKSCQRS